MNRLTSTTAAVVCVAALGIAPSAQVSEKLDYETIGKISEEGLNRSQVMEHIIWLSDVYGPRLTGSPGIAQAGDWTMKKFQEWGLANVHQEKFAFGKGWSVVRFSAHLIEPQVQPLIGYPERVDLEHERRRDRRSRSACRSRRTPISTSIAGSSATGSSSTQPARAVRMLEGPVVLRMGEADIREAETTAGASRAGRGARPAVRAEVRVHVAAAGRRCSSAFSSSSRMRASWRYSAAAATATCPPVAATCRGRRSASMAARSSRAAADRATRRRARGCRRRRWLSSTTTGWCASSIAAFP